jgi:hypothetical protein
MHKKGSHPASSFKFLQPMSHESFPFKQIIFVLSVRCLENLLLHLRSLLYQKNGYSVHYQSSLIFNLWLALFIYALALRIQLSLFRRYLGFSQRKSQRSRLGHAVRVSSHFLNEYQTLSYQFIRLYLLLNLNALLKRLEIN